MKLSKGCGKVVSTYNPRFHENVKLIGGYMEEKEKLKEKVEIFQKAYVFLEEKLGAEFKKKNIGNKILSKIDKLNMKIYLK